MITLIILISIYILSAISWWLLVHKFEKFPRAWMVVATLIPIVNTVVILAGILSLIIQAIDKLVKNRINANKFFKIK